MVTGVRVVVFFPMYTYTLKVTAHRPILDCCWFNEIMLEGDKCDKALDHTKYC